MVPEDKIILIKFTSLDIENQVGCDHDYVSLQSSNGMLISKCITFIFICHFRVLTPELLKDLKLDFCTQDDYFILQTVPFLQGWECVW